MQIHLQINVPKHAQQKLLTMKIVINYVQVENQITSICFARLCKRMQVIEFVQWTPESPWEWKMMLGCIFNNCNG